MDDLHEEEMLTLRHLLRCLENMDTGKPFDLTDSPRSYMDNTRRMVKEARAAIEMIRVAA